jgi:uncharacterized protein YlaI
MDRLQKKDKNMKCIICHSEDIVEKEVMEEIKNINDIIYLPIKTNVCLNCGERYYDRQTLQKIEDFEKQIKDKNIILKEVGKVLIAS